MSEPFGAALIGTGFWGARIAQAAARTGSLRIVACYSRDEGRKEAFAARFGCEAAPSFEAAIEHPEVKGALIVTPNFTHAAQGTACALRGVHVFVEKPIADSLEDAVALRDACRAAGVALLVGHSFRRLGAAREVKRLLDEGALGEIVLAEANFSLTGRLTPDKWRYYRETCPGGPLMQLGIHHADTLQYWLGPAARVRGSFARLVTPAEIDDVGAALIEFENGAPAALSSSYVSPRTYSLRLSGTAATLEYVTDMSVWPEAEKVDGATLLTLRTSGGRSNVEFEACDMLVEELEEFVRCALGEAEPETGAEEAIAALRVVLGAIRSHETDQAVDLRTLKSEESQHAEDHHG